MLKKLIDKILGLYVYLRYNQVDPKLRYFYRDTIYCKLMQWKYVVRDYLVKKPYKQITFNGEFGPELQFVLPFAYWHHKNGTLKSTISSTHTAELYFFSPNHTEVFEKRNIEGNYNFETPRILYSQDYNIKKWIPVPLKEKYQNNIYVFDKPVLIVANRFNKEWDGPPISYFSIEMLAYIFDTLKDKYKIIYNRPRAEQITMDNSDIYDLKEFEWIRKNYPEVTLMQDLYEENKGNARNFNHLQLMVYANADYFISTHGGTAILASYFKGTNLILSVKGPEHHFKCFKKLYPQYSGATIHHAKSDEELKLQIEKYLVGKKGELKPVH